MTSFQVKLILYDFKIFPNLPLSSLTHSEVIVHGKSFGYDDEDGITVIERENLDGLYNYKIKAVIPLGVTTVTENQLSQKLRML